mgnify:CR=1 FL=1
MAKKAIGIDIGGTGIKGAIVDVNSCAGFDYPTEIAFHASNCKDPKPAPPPPPPPPKPDYSKYKFKDFVHFPPLDLAP